MLELDTAFRELTDSDADIAEIVEFIREAFPSFEQALGAMGQQGFENPQSADSSLVRLRVEPVTTASVK